jgi:hypothetical protein
MLFPDPRSAVCFHNTEQSATVVYRNDVCVFVRYKNRAEHTGTLCG